MSATPSLQTNAAFKNAAWTSPERARSYARDTASRSDLTHFVTAAYLEHLTRRIPAGARVLDLGCGTGVLTKAIAAQGFDTTGVDISAAMLSTIRPDEPHHRIALHQGDVFDLPFPEASFDGVVTRWVIPHFRNWAAIVAQAGRVLVPGGTLVFDHCSRDNYALAAAHRPLDHRAFGYDPRVDGDADVFYAAASREELQMAADLAGLELVAVEPQSFFRQNALIAASVGGDGIAVYKRALEHFWQDAGVQAFVQWFESNVTPLLPHGLANGLTVVMRKPGPSRTGG